LLSLEDLATLNRPDIRPSINPSWTPELAPNEIGRRTCLLSRGMNSGVIHHQSDGELPCIRRRDLKDLRRIWLKNNYGNTNNPSLLRGYWRIENWEQVGDKIISTLQYRTLRVCLRGGSGNVV